MGRLRFTLEAEDPVGARAGVLHTPHGDVPTPAFMPVGTLGVVKTLAQEDLETLGYRLVLANTYHLWLRPGVGLIERAGGLGSFMGWRHALLTDSGGYQVMSLCEFRKVSEEGVLFRSHLDGDQHMLTPESVTEVQRRLGVDIGMALDECPPYPCTRDEAALATERTARWAERCLRARAEDQTLFGIVQGGVHEDLRRASAERTAEMDFDGLAIGGVSVGEPTELQRPVVQMTAPLLPKTKPRYLMGVGQPADILHAIGCGVDMFDCVLPTRGGRHNVVYTPAGRADITNKSFEERFGPLDEQCTCAVCARYSAAYLRHLCRMKEPTGARLLTYHNLHYYFELVAGARRAILDGYYAAYVDETLHRLGETG
ncbi:MAG: tRNA guanosine(34) transglycosylase Tgt [Fimbriimonadia bacterium]|jgi:queuine tRNA-ribosyltransferase